jgi:Na+-driven multidrug efflux pump
MAILAVRRTVKAGVYGMIVLGFLFILVPGVFVRIFSPEPDVYSIASIVVQISALELIGVTLNMIYGGAMRGAGDTVSPMIVTFIGAISKDQPGLLDDHFAGLGAVRRMDCHGD